MEKDDEDQNSGIDGKQMKGKKYGIIKYRQMGKMEGERTMEKMTEKKD